MARTFGGMGGVMGMPYGMLGNFNPDPQHSYANIPELSAQEGAIANRQRIAQILLFQGMQPPQEHRDANNNPIPISPFQALGGIAQMAAGAHMIGRSEKAMLGLANQRKQMIADEMAKIQGIEGGKPAIPGSVPTLPGGGPVQPDTPAVPGNPDAAREMMIMSQFPQIQNWGNYRQKVADQIANREDMQTQQKALLASQQEQANLAREENNTVRADISQRDRELRAYMHDATEDTKRLIIGLTHGANKAINSPVSQKELIQTHEEIAGSQQAIDHLKQALAINKDAMGFVGAGAITSAGSLLPESIRPKTIDATANLDNIITGSALPQLKSIFGGMPTEGERKVLLDVQGSSGKNPAVREEIFKRAIMAAERRINIGQDKAKKLQEGTYFRNAVEPTAKPTTPAASPVGPLLEKYK